MDKTLNKEKYISYEFDPYEESFKHRALLNYDVFFFVDTSESFPFITCESLKIIGKRTGFSKIPLNEYLIRNIEISQNDRKFLIDSLYSSEKQGCIIPVKDKTLVIFNRLFRSCGLGIAFYFNCKSEYISALYHSEIIDLYNDFDFSENYKNINQDDRYTMDFASSLYEINTKIQGIMGNFSEKSDFNNNFIDLITYISEISGCRINISIPMDYKIAKIPETKRFSVIMLSILSAINRISSNRVANITLKSKESKVIRIEFNVDIKISDFASIPEISFCDRLTKEFSTPFFFSADGGKGEILFVPHKEDPSLSGLKAGIYIDGKKLVSKNYF